MATYSSPTDLPFTLEVPSIPIPFIPVAQTKWVSSSDPSSSSPTSNTTPRPTENQNELLPTSSTPSASPSTNNLLPSPTSPPTPLTTTITFTSSPPSNDGNNWEGMASGAHTGVIMSVIIGLIFIVALSFWFCCGGKARWNRRNSHAQTQNSGILPLHNRIEPAGRGVNREVHGADAPPQYEEVAPPSHQRLAGGMQLPGMGGGIGVGDEGEGVVADGKMPASEMVLEDVVLERGDSRSESSDGEGSESRRFEQMHHGLNGLGGGDTRGHTNT